MIAGLSSGENGENLGTADSNSAGTRAPQVAVTFDLREFLTALWQGRWVILAATFLFGVAATGLVLWLPDQYKAEAVVMPASLSSNSPLSSFAGQLGGLASLAGINVGGGQGAGDRALMAIELMKTWDFLDKFIRERGIEAELLATQGWDPVNNRMIFDPSIYDSERRSWIRSTGEPNSWELYEEFRDRIEINQDKHTGLISLSVEHYSPTLAKAWVDGLLESVNKHLREQDKADARKSIAYLEKQLEATNLTEMQNIFYGLIEEQTKNLMLAEVSDEYALKILSPAKVPEERSQPKRVLLVVLGVLLGFLCGAFAWLALLYEPSAEA